MSTAPTHEQIAVLAFERYASRGYQNGHDLDDWYWAQAFLLAQETAPAAAPAKAHDHDHHEHGHHHHEHDHHQHGAHDTRHRH
jgi:hypothetical protein